MDRLMCILVTDEQPPHSLASPEGGVGKTTSAVHIAGQLIRNIGYRCGVAVVICSRPRSAMEQGREAAVFFVCGTQDAVITRHYDFSALVIGDSH
jgi:hypothetical protein